MNSLNSNDFNAADFDKWRKRDLWTLNEGISLVLGYEPKFKMHEFNHESNRPYYDRTLGHCSGEIKTEAEFADNYRDLYNFARNSMDVGLLEPYNDRYRWPPAEFAREFYPRVFLEWVQSKGYEIPEELGRILLRSSKIESRRVQPIAAKERPADSGLSNKAGSKREKSREGQNSNTDPLLVFRNISGLSPSDVTLSFLADNMIEVSANGKSKRISYELLNLLDNRNGALNKQGTILLGMATGKKISKSSSKSSSKSISRIRILFKECLGVESDPFQKDWLPHFKVFDKRMEKDKRAKADATHVSYNEEQEYSFDTPEDTDPAAQYLNYPDKSDQP